MNNSIKTAESFKSCQEIRNETICNLKYDIARESIKPCVCIIQVGEDPASIAYARGKLKDCENCGIRTIYRRYDKNITQSCLNVEILKANYDCDITGIIVMLPLPDHLDSQKALSCISPHKDIDGFSQNSPYIPCTPQGIMTFCKDNNIDLTGKHCVIINRSKNVGRPLADLFLKNNATVTVCHSYTNRENLKELTKIADIVVVAVGKKDFITQDMVKDSAIIFDVGINKDIDGSMCGDVSKEVKCMYRTPVPKGVGLLTRASFIQNAYQSFLYRKVK